MITNTILKYKRLIILILTNCQEVRCTKIYFVDEMSICHVYHVYVYNYLYLNVWQWNLFVFNFLTSQFSLWDKMNYVIECKDVFQIS